MNAETITAAKTGPPAVGPPAPSAGALRQVLRVVGVAILLSLLIHLLMGGGGPLSPGAQAPVTRGQTLDGGAFDLADWVGQPVFVNVWATWCGPCLQELPELAAAARRHPEIRFVGLVADSNAADIARVVARAGTPYPNLAIDGATQRAWNALAVPSSFVLGRDGKIVASVAGGLAADDIEKLVLLAR